jgi:hypothetical protein
LIATCYLEHQKKWDENHITEWPITIDLLALITIDLAMSMTLIFTT